MLMIIFNTAKNSTTFGYHNEIFTEIRFFPFYILSNKRRNRISINGLREHIFKEIFKLNMQ